MLRTCSSELAVSWMSGDGCRRPFGSPGLYGHSQPHGQPLSAQRYMSPSRAQPSKMVGPQPSAAVKNAVHGPLPHFCGPTVSVMRYSNAWLSTIGLSTVTSSGGTYGASSRMRQRFAASQYCQSDSTTGRPRNGPSGCRQ